MDLGRDASTISPSALSLLVLKSQTSIPYARAAAELLYGVDGVARELEEPMRMRGAEIRVRHFEDRYRSVDTLLEDSGAMSVLEIAGGLSFRGLALAERRPVFYADTDLPPMAERKARLVAALHPGPLVGTLRVGALDALDAAAFRAAVDELPPGRFALVNEGLLMYLGREEKERLAGQVREALLHRGGVWITADIYVRTAPDPLVEKSERLRRFLDEHQVEENKFTSLDEAEGFFAAAGLGVVQRHASPADAGPPRQTWALAARP